MEYGDINPKCIRWIRDIEVFDGHFFKKGVSMRYLSTRGRVGGLSFEDAVLMGRHSGENIA